jgi:hypothetical protein
MYGAGRIIRTALQSTYSRLLAGDKNGYAALWTSLLQEAAGRDASAERWQPDPLLPVVDQPVKVLLRHAGNGLPQGLFGTEDEGATPVVTYLEQRSLQPFAWEGLYWPSVAGWQSVRTSESDRTWWYAWPANDWQTLRRMERARDTRWVGKGERTATEEQRVPMSRGWFYLLVVLACLFLWVERKI